MAPSKKNAKSVVNIENLPFDISKLSEESKVIVSILMYTVNQSQEMFAKANEEKDNVIKCLSEKVNKLELKLAIIDNKLDEKESTERLNDIVISGQNVLPGKQGENTKTVVIDMLRDKLHLNINPNDIGISHRIGKRNVNAPDLRSILVKLSTNEAKQNIMNACKTAKPERIFINENLSPARNSIMYVLRKAKKDFPDIVSGCNSMDGNVYAWIKPPNGNAPGARASRMQINDYKKLSNFCTEVINSSVSAYISDWQH